MINPKTLDFIEGMNKEELRKLHDDLLNNKIQEQVNVRLAQMEERQTVCPVCNNNPGPAGLTLIFGPVDLRKKATFCGYDCLEYFLNILKEVSHESHKHELEKQEQEMTAKGIKTAKKTAEGNDR